MRNETYKALRENKQLTARRVRELDAFAKANGVEIALEEIVAQGMGYIADHTEMSDEVLKNVPYLLENLILIMESKSYPNRVTMLGDIYGENGVPVLAVVELMPYSRKGYKQNYLVLVNAYTKANENTAPDDLMKGTQSIIDTSTMLYVDPDKKRTDTWLSLNRLQLPLGITKYGPIGKITYVERDVKGKFSSQPEKTEIPEWKDYIYTMQ